MRSFQLKTIETTVEKKRPTIFKLNNLHLVTINQLISFVAKPVVTFSKAPQSFYGTFTVFYHFYGILQYFYGIFIKIGQHGWGEGGKLRGVFSKMVQRL